jgi:hypothetical protein
MAAAKQSPRRDPRAPRSSPQAVITLLSDDESESEVSTSDSEEGIALPGGRRRQRSRMPRTTTTTTTTTEDGGAGAGATTKRKLTPRGKLAKGKKSKTKGVFKKVVSTASPAAKRTGAPSANRRDDDDDDENDVFASDDDDDDADDAPAVLQHVVRYSSIDQPENRTKVSRLHLEWAEGDVEHLEVGDFVEVPNLNEDEYDADRRGASSSGGAIPTKVSVALVRDIIETKKRGVEIKVSWLYDKQDVDDCVGRGRWVPTRAVKCVPLFSNESPYDATAFARRTPFLEDRLFPTVTGSIPTRRDASHRLRLTRLRAPLRPDVTSRTGATTPQAKRAVLPPQNRGRHLPRDDHRESRGVLRRRPRERAQVRLLERREEVVLRARGRGVHQDAERTQRGEVSSDHRHGFRAGVEAAAAKAVPGGGADGRGGARGVAAVRAVDERVRARARGEHPTKPGSARGAAREEARVVAVSPFADEQLDGRGRRRRRRRIG